MSYQNQRYPQQYPQRRRRGSAFSGLKLRLIIGAAIVLFSVVSFMNKGEINPVTGYKQRVDMTIREEINNGLASVGQMGPQSRNRRAQDHVDEIGFKLVKQLQQHLYRQKGIEIPYPFEFHLLAKPEINAFALPGGQVFLTETLYRALEGTPGEHDARIAGVLGHEIGHVIERHGAERLAKGNLISGIVGAAGVAGGDMSGRSAASYVGNLINMKYGRGDELEADKWGIELMMLSNYDPHYLLDVMEVLKKSGGAGTPEFLSTHPSSETRIEEIKRIIQQKQSEIGQIQNRQILNIE